MANLSGKVAVITGSSRGIGAECALELAKNGAKVVVNYCKNKDKAEDVKKKILDLKGTVEIFGADVRNIDEVLGLVKFTKEKFGTADILVNNAVASVNTKDFLNTKWEDFQGDIDVILKGAINCTQSFLPGMIEKKSGNIINIITYYAMNVPPAKLASYVTAKSALLGLSKALAAEYGSYGIKVNMVSPGLTATDLTAHLPERFKDIIAASTPLKRIAKPSDIAKAVSFLASGDADFITGCNIPVCGGIAMY